MLNKEEAGKPARSSIQRAQMQILYKANVCCNLKNCDQRVWASFLSSTLIKCTKAMLSYAYWAALFQSVGWPLLRPWLATTRWCARIDSAHSWLAVIESRHPEAQALSRRSTLVETLQESDTCSYQVHGMPTSSSNLNSPTWICWWFVIILSRKPSTFSECIRSWNSLLLQAAALECSICRLINDQMK